MIEQKLLSGVMNLDDGELEFPASHHKYAMNMRFVGGEQGYQAQNIKGTTLLDNDDLPAGTNECIGSHYDPVRKRIYAFIWNSNDNHLIYYFDIQLGTFTSIIQIGSQTGNEDILGFSPDYPITSINIIYTDEGDLLCWCNENKRPRCVNVSTIGSYSTLVESNINLAKVWPWYRAVTTYQSDTSTISNLLNRKLFQFRYRWVYDNNMKSTWSPWSRVILPSNFDNNDTNPTNNNRISISVSTGGQDVKKIEIAGRQSLGTTWSDPFLIESLSKVDYGFTADTLYSYLFYNDAAYPPIDINESNLLFSYVPDLANCQELLNGNVLIFGGITEGYDQMAKADVDVVITASLGTPVSPFIGYSFSGLHEVVVQIGSTVPTGTVYNVSFNYSSGVFGDTSPKAKSYTALAGDDADDVATALAALIHGNNIIAAPLGGGAFRIITSTGSGTITNFSTSVGGSGSEDAGAAWPWFERYRLGLIYFDEFGKTPGVVSFVNTSGSNTDFDVTMPAFSVLSGVVQRPYISASINHTPPSWAKSYQWVRTPRLLTNNFLYHVTNDYQEDTNFLYFCIENLNDLKNRNTGFIPSYEFASGDRIKVLASYNTTTNQYSPYATFLDFEIVGTVERAMGSPASDGVFVKVRKPTTTYPGFSNNMLVLLYTPAVRAIDLESQVFYEFGQTYEIYELGDRLFHRGDLADQTAVQAATFQFYEGDVYYKRRHLYIEVGDVATQPAYVMDANFNDYFPSAINSNGRAVVIDANAKRTYNPVLRRWGLSYQEGTNINQINILQPVQFDEVDRGKGDIMRFKARDRILRTFQKRGIGMDGVYARFITNRDDATQLITTNDILTPDNIQYYQGEYGIGDYATNLASGVIQDYVSDHVRGVEIRLSQDGITPISTLYKGQYHIKNLLTPYNKQYSRSNGYKAKIMKYYDYFDNQCVTILQGGNLYSENKLRFVENGVIEDGDINSANQTEIAYAANNSYNEYILSFSGTPTPGAVVKITLSLDSVPRATLPIAIQSGWTLTNLCTFLAALINGDADYNATVSTYLGNPAVFVRGAAGTETVLGVSTITYPVYIATFRGTPRIGDVVSITAYYTSVDPKTYTYTVQNGDTISTIISNLASQASAYFTVESVTYEGYPGLTLKYIPSYNIQGEGEITLAVLEGSVTSSAYSFNEPRNGYCSFYDKLQPDWIICAEDATYSWKNGQLYVHNSETYCNFYGEQTDAYIDLVFNINKMEKKTWLGVTEIANGIWVCPIIYSNVMAYANQRQETNLVEAEFTVLEQNPTASFKRDIWSRGGKINGSVMKGNYLVVRFKKSNASSLITLSSVAVQFNDSPFNVK